MGFVELIYTITGKMAEKIPERISEDVLIEIGKSMNQLHPKSRTPRRIPETIDEKELMQIMKAMEKPHHRLAIALGFYQGLRVSEICNLMPEHINKDKRLLTVKQGKGKKDRVIPIHPKLIWGLKQKLPIPCGVRALEIAFKNYGRKALGRDLYFHCLRHSTVPYYLYEHKPRWDLKAAQIFLGHSKITTTERYTHVKPENLINLMYGEE